MQKKIIALAIAAAMAAPVAALAEVTVYGQVNMAYESVDSGGDSGTAAAPVGTSAYSKSRVSSNASRLGLKGSDDLGDGLTAVWQMEGQVNTDDGTHALFGRNTFAGISGGFGTVVLGNHDTPYKLATRKLDVFADSIADNRNIMGGPLHDARLTDVLAYISPDFSGASFAVAMVGGTDNTLGGAATTETSATSLSAKYGMDAWSVALANQTITAKDSVVAANKSEATATKVAGTYAMDAFSVGLVYEMLSSKTGATSIKGEQNNIYVAGTYNVSEAGKVKLAYTMAGEQKFGGVTQKATAASQVSLGYDHALSKNTSVFALYTSVSNDYDAATTSGSSYGLGSSSASTGFTAAGPVAAGGSGNPSAIAVGVRHSF